MGVFDDSKCMKETGDFDAQNIFLKNNLVEGKCASFLSIFNKGNSFQISMEIWKKNHATNNIFLQNLMKRSRLIK